MVDGRVLVVDDQHTHRMMVGAILMGFGLDVSSVDSGELAVDRLSLEPEAFDLVILDWEMPGMDGLETVREIRTRQEANGWKHIPVLAFTSNKRDGDIEKCIEAGMDDYLHKESLLPKWQEILLEKLKELIPQDKV
ncbi:MAG: response regulator [Alphaproteobacteria bacterium]